MWSDPEMASLDRIRENVNKDIAQGMRFGGFLLCSVRHHSGGHIAFIAYAPWDYFYGAIFLCVNASTIVYF